MVSFFNYFVTCNKTATISDVIGWFQFFYYYFGAYLSSKF